MISEKSLQKLLLFIGIFISKISADPGQKCSTDLLDTGCKDTETCVVTETGDTGVCDCLPGYNKTEDGCVLPSGGGDIVNTSHILAWTFTILILIAIVIVGVYFIHRLRVVDWVRCKVSQRYNRSYDDVMIGEDEE